jgi:hypothetical protein
VTLGDFLLAPERLHGPWNCSTLPADWVVGRGHPDFAADWRDITDPSECDWLAGQLAETWATAIGDGLPAVDGESAAGDIGVIRVRDTDYGAIFDGQNWAVRAERRLVFLRPDAVEVVGAWRP